VYKFTFSQNVIFLVSIIQQLPLSNRDITKIFAFFSTAGKALYYNVVLCHVRIIFVPLQLSQQPDTISLEKKRFYGDLMSPATIKHTYIHLRVMCPIFLTDLNQIWYFSPVFQRRFQYHISCTFVQWEKRCTCEQTDRQKYGWAWSRQ